MKNFMKNCEDKFLEACEKISAQDQKILVACSGGSDSLALVELFLAAGFKIGIAHFDHQIRGEESKADSVFVENYAREKKLPFHLGTANVIDEAKKNSRSHRSIETTARELRYKFFFETAEKFSYDLISTAHHRDDQAETVLMNLIRGTGFEGLSGIQPRAGILIRPLLAFSKAELEKYCAEKNLQPRHDSTNDLPNTTRNKIRLEILPALQKINPAVVTSLNRFALISTDDHDFIRTTAEKIFEHGLHRKKFIEQHVSIQRELLRLFFESLQLKNISFDQTEAVRNLFIIGRGRSSIDIPGGRVSVEHGTLNFYRR